jgi:signal transduction histidine kinase
MRPAVLHFLLGLTLLLGLVPPVRAQAAADGAGERITLSEAERAWVAAHPVVRVGHDPTYSPYALQNTAGQIVGIDPDYLELIARRTGLKFQNEIRADWGRMIEDFRAGQVDLLMSLSHAADREAYLTYSHSYAFAANVVVTRSDAPNLSALGDLKGHTISLPRGDAGLRRNLEQNVPGAIVVEYENPAECYEAVARGEVYASLGDVANASYVFKAHRLTNLRFGSVLPTTTEIFMGVRKDWPVLLSILNQAAAGIRAEERQRINERWIVADPAAGRWWAQAFRIATAVASVIGVVFLLVLFHNRRLALELAERRRIQTELEQTRDRLVRSNKERSELMHMVAHDLRGPLSAIQLGLELLRFDPPLSEERRKLTTRRIGESSELMARLINDLLSTQNVEEGRYALEVAPGDVGQHVRTAVAALDTIAQHKRIAVTTRLPENPIPLVTDFVALQQVIDNLLSNALKYSPLGTKVEVAVTATATHCRLAVCDEGPGVKEEEREKIFEKYSRGSARPTQGEISTGLGLWIVRRFVTALHGRVWCEAGPGAVGTVFVVEMPLKPPAD